MPRRTGQSKQTRLRIAHEAARLMVEHGIGDYGLAKRKAAAQLGVVDKGSLPRNTEIEAALLESRRLFGGPEHHSRIARMRACAVDVMTALTQFEPRAVGALVAGSIGANSAIELHLFSEPAEAFGMTLIDRSLDHSIAESRLRTARDQYEIFPAFVFDAEEFEVEATVFPLDGLRQAPLSPVDGRPMRRLSVSAMRALLDEAGDDFASGFTRMGPA